QYRRTTRTTRRKRRAEWQSGTQHQPTPAARGLRHPRAAPRCTRTSSATTLSPARPPPPWLAASSRSVIPMKPAIVRGALLEESVAALFRFFAGVRQAGGFAGKQLLPHQPLVGKVEAVLEHADRRRALAHDLAAPGQCADLELLVGNHRVDHTHSMRF